MSARQNFLRNNVPGWVIRPPTREVPALDIDWANDRAWLKGIGYRKISDLITISRANTGYYTKADGTLVSFNSNVLRYGMNGLLVEEARTNLCLQSQTFDNSGAWTANVCTITADQAVAPDGTTTADLLAESTGSSAHDVQYNVSLTITAATNYAQSVYVKAGTRSFVGLTAYGGANNWATAVFDLTNGSATAAAQTGTGATSGTVASTKQEALANGWFRLTLVAQTATTTYFQFISSVNAATGNTFDTTGRVVFSGNASNNFYVWGAQVELGSFATSYIPTTSASATRAADAITFSSIPAVVTSIASGSGSMFIQYPSTNINDGYYFEFGGNRPVFYKNTSNTNASYDGTTTDLNSKTEQATTGAVNKLARSWNTTNLVGAINGAASSSVGYDGDWNIGTPAIGRYGVGNLHYINSYLQRLAVFNVALAGAALTTLTT